MKIIQYAVLGLALVSGGCSLIIGEERANRLERLIEIGNHMKKGIPDYYTPEEIAERNRENEFYMRKISGIIERNKKGEQ